MTGIALVSADPRADYAELKEKGVDVDNELMGGRRRCAAVVLFRDHDENRLMVAEAQ